MQEELEVRSRGTGRGDELFYQCKFSRKGVSATSVMYYFQTLETKYFYIVH